MCFGSSKHSARTDVTCLKDVHWCETMIFAVSGSKYTKFTIFHGVVGDPVDAGVVKKNSMAGIDHVI